MTLVTLCYKVADRSARPAFPALVTLCYEGRKGWVL
jgi:hypothetical protein